MSSGSPANPSGMPAAARAAAAASARISAVSRVRTRPGAIALTRVLSGPYETALAPARASSAPFLAAQAWGGPSAAPGAPPPPPPAREEHRAPHPDAGRPAGDERHLAVEPPHRSLRSRGRRSQVAGRKSLSCVVRRGEWEHQDRHWPLDLQTFDL